LAASVSNTAHLLMLAILSVGPPMSLAQSTRGGLLDLGGYRVYTAESGVGDRAVVFEAGLGEDIATWNDVGPEVARFARTFAYDRPGLGKSDPSPRPRTIQQMTAELHALLHAAKVPPPYILVGHSLGGAIVQVFAHSYPTEVAGLVLVDPENGRLDEMLRARMTATDWAVRQKAVDEAMPNMPAAVKAEMNAYQGSGKYVDEAFPLPDVPVILLTGTKKNPEFPGNPLEQDLKLELHNALLAKMPGGKHVLAPNSRHYIQNDAPNLVIEAIRGIVSNSASATEPAHNK
jgi:pimeloyl-ACP methyl ester carboxylesterase